MDRRSFLLAAAAGTTVAATGAGYWRWQALTPQIDYAGRQVGHFLRDRHALPPPSYEVTTDVAILGSGVAGLTAAWKMQREGQRNFLILDGPEKYGNAAGGRFGSLAFPTGAHYLPLPSAESSHVREILHDLGIILKNPGTAKPCYDERFILHAPEERVLFNGNWQEGILPRDGVPAADLAEHDRFARHMTAYRDLHGSDGKRVFVMPSALSSSDPAWLALDRISFRQWLESQGYRAPTLHWYTDYCTRDDYGAGYDVVSAWAGLHYFCSRGGEAENASPGAWLTWPGGLDPLLQGLDHAAGHRRRAGTAQSVKRVGNGVHILCFELINGVPKTFLIKARKAICAMPLMVAARIVDGIAETGFDAAVHMPTYAPWLVANFLMRRFPPELPAAALSWDNVVYGSSGLGYVVSTHQDIRVTPPEKTVFTSYVALADRTPQAARTWLDTAPPDVLLDRVSSDLRAAYGNRFSAHVERVDITLRAHAMATPRPGFRTNAGLQGLRDADGAVLYAHADLSGFSVFEEAAWWGAAAAVKALR